MFLHQPLLFKSLCYINGRWVHSDSGTSQAVHNPADQSVLGHVPLLEPAQIDAAVHAAHQAFRSWRHVNVQTRSQMLLRWAQLMAEHRDDLATLVTLEQGKPIREAAAEIDYAASFIVWYAEQARRLDGRLIPSHIDGAQPGTLKAPVSVAALITPWNFPSAMITRKASAALAAGCTVVVKPAHETPYSALALAHLAEQAGFAPGLFNVVLGEPQMAMETLVSHPQVRSISFTGSTRVGHLVRQTAARAGIKHLALELGGNAPFIVTADADPQAAAEIAVTAKFQTSGQDCCAANRIFVHRSHYQTFLRHYTQAVSALQVGPGLEADSHIGPLIHTAALTATTERVADAMARGAHLLTGGHPHARGGLYFEPTVLADVGPGMRIYDEENFAPISGVCAFDTLEAVIDQANDTPYGLAAYICATREDVIWHLLRHLDFAMIAVNGARFTGAPIPFGGMKESGAGREGGTEGFEPFIETRYFCLNRLGTPTDPPAFQGAHHDQDH